MTDVQQLHQQIDEFEAHYEYNSDYLRSLLETSPSGYEKLANFLPLASHRELLPLEDFWIAKLSTMQSEDCGACLELNIKMAREQSFSDDLIRATLKSPTELPENYQTLIQYCQQVSSSDAVASDIMDQMHQHYSEGQLLELGVAIASARMFPTIKRAIGDLSSCAILDLAV